MSKILIYLNDQLTDPPVTRIATTLNGIDIFNFTALKANFTNNIKFPDTPTNREIFGYANNVESVSEIPYRSFTCTVLSDGIEIINGSFILRRYDGTFNGSVYSRETSLFDLIKGRRVYDAKGLLMPDILNGLFTDPEIFETNSAQQLTAMPQMPVSYYKDLVEGLLTLHGYEFEGDVFSDTKYLLMSVTAGNGIWATLDGGTINTTQRGTGVYQNDFTVSLINDNAQVFNYSHGSGGIDTDTLFVFDTILKDDIYNSCQANNQTPYLFNYPYSGRAYSGIWKIIASVTLTAVGDVGGVATSILLDLIYNGGAELETLNLGSPGAATFSVGQTKLVELSALFTTFPIPFVAGDTVQCRIRTQGDGVSAYTATVTVNYCNLHNDDISFVLEGGSASITTPYPAYASGMLAGLTQESILKDFMVRFGLVMKEKNNKLTFKALDDIISQKESVDWTMKRVKRKSDNIELSVSSISQVNYLKYDQADDYTGEFLGSGVIEAYNENLQAERDFFVSPFSTCANINAGSSNGTPSGYYYLAKMSADSITPRVLLIRDKRSNEPTLPGQAEKILYSDDPNATITDLRFDTVIEDHYKGFTASVQRLKVVSRIYDLNENDIHSFDPFKLVHDNASYFIPIRIHNYIPGQLTKVDLLKVV